MNAKKTISVFDKCQYKNCKNGVHNGYYLLRFPAEKDPRHGIWLQNAGNPRLEGWSAASIRKGGLCPVHFRPEMFVDRGFPAARIGRRRLQKHAVPRPYHEVDQKQVLHTSSQADYDTYSNTITSTKQTGSCPDNVSARVNKGDKTSIDLQCKSQTEDAEHSVAPQQICGDTPNLECRAQEATEVTMAVVDNMEREQQDQSSASTGNIVVKERQYPRYPLLFSDIENDSMDCLNMEPPARIMKKNEARTRLSEKVEKSVGNDQHIKDRVIMSLRKENTGLRKNLRNVMLQLNRARATQRRLAEKVKRYSNVDGFLTVARTMARLKLHKPKYKYSNDELDLEKE